MRCFVSETGRNRIGSRYGRLYDAMRLETHELLIFRIRVDQSAHSVMSL